MSKRQRTTMKTESRCQTICKQKVSKLYVDRHHTTFATVSMPMEMLSLLSVKDLSGPSEFTSKHLMVLFRPERLNNYRYVGKKLFGFKKKQKAKCYKRIFCKHCELKHRFLLLIFKLHEVNNEINYVPLNL